MGAAFFAGRQVCGAIQGAGIWRCRPVNDILVKKRDFWRQLVQTGGYRSPERRQSYLIRNCPFCRSFIYHLRVNLIVMRCGTFSCMRLFDTIRWAEACQDMVKVAEICGGRLDVDGLQNLSGRKGPFVFVCNHMSSVETLQLAGITAPFSDTTFVVKKSLMIYPFMGDLLKAMNAIPLGRRNARDDLQCVLTQGKDRLSKGVSVIVFPQSTRSDVFSRRKFTSIGAKLAVHAGVPVVPVAVKTDFVANGTIVKDLGRVYPERPIYYRFGPVLEPAGNGKEVHAKTMEFIIGCLGEWGAKIED